jgi:hypothetical protein
MATTTFHLFPLLPQELRDMIWDAAIRSLDTPGVHLFTADLTKWGRTNKQIPDLTLTPPDIHALFRGHNPSTYLLDSGVWTACKDSYVRMRHVFNGQKSQSKPVGTSYFTLPRAQAQFFTVLPAQDLFIFRMPVPHATETMWFRFLYNWGSYGIRHGALEFDPGWMDPDCPVDAWAQIADAMTQRPDTGALRALWFVDYTLKREKGVPLDGKRAVFTGTNCRFVEVLFQDVGNVDKPWRSEWGCANGLADHESYQFVLRLGVYHGWRTRKIENALQQDPSLEVHMPSWISYGVLVCDHFDAFS